MSAQGKAKRRKPSSAALGQQPHTPSALKGRYNPSITQGREIPKKWLHDVFDERFA